jgi:hypothetical protein
VLATDKGIDMQRRQFIISGIGAAAYAGLGATAALAAQGAALQLNAASFATMLHQPFNVYDSARGVTVELVKVKEIAGSPGLRQFSLSFKGRAEDGLETGTYEVEHAAIGKVLMYLDADKRGKQGVMYRADFNLL